MQNCTFYLIEFWLKHPALLYGVACLIGFYGALYQTSLVLIPILCLWLPSGIYGWKRINFNYKPFILSFLLLFISASYAMIAYPVPSLPIEGLKGKACLTIESVSSHSSYFGRRWIYRCQLQHLFDEQGMHQKIRNVKCQISFPQQKQWSRPPANQNYLVQGTLTYNTKGQYLFKVDKNTLWYPIEGTWSLAEWRYKAKKKAKAFILKIFSNPQSASFLAGLLTGEFENLTLRQSFARFGLQHILAISGFHFTIIASVINQILLCLISRKKTAFVTISLLTGYLLFLGGQPSILRAWLMICIPILGDYLERATNGLNSLGVALLITLFIDPLQCQEWGFQFSYLITAAILLFYSVIDRYLMTLLPKRPLSQLIEMHKWDLHGHCLLALFRQSLALTIAVSLVAYPLTLYYFHSFPIMSLLYNLFFPLLVSLSLALLLMGMMTQIIPFIGQGIHELNNYYTHWILALTSDMPSSIDYYHRIDALDKAPLILYLCLALMCGIWIRSFMLKKIQTPVFTYT